MKKEDIIPFVIIIMIALPICLDKKWVDLFIVFFWLVSYLLYMFSRKETNAKKTILFLAKILFFIPLCIVTKGREMHVWMVAAIAVILYFVREYFITDEKKKKICLFMALITFFAYTFLFLKSLLFS